MQEDPNSERLADLLPEKYRNAPERSAESAKQSTAAKGKQYEDKACEHLTTLGYRIIKRNFRWGKTGEIDIVAMDGDTLVFVEVKARTSYAYGTPEESINVRKQTQLKRLARMYFYVNGIQEHVCRFDVIAIDALYGTTELRHHINAFY